MSHIRTRIRQKLAELLSGLGMTVTSNRTTPLQPGELPCISIFAHGEEVQEVTNSRTQDRTADILVDVYIKGAADLDDQLDAKALQVEQAVAAGRKLGNLVDKVALVSTRLDETTVAEVRVGVARLHYRVSYRTPFAQPDA